MNRVEAFSELGWRGVIALPRLGGNANHRTLNRTWTQLHFTYERTSIQVEKGKTLKKKNVEAEPQDMSLQSQHLRGQGRMIRS